LEFKKKIKQKKMQEELEKGTKERLEEKGTKKNRKT